MWTVFCSYVWEHLEMGYVQGMCDLLAPLMVILDDGEKPRGFQRLSSFGYRVDPLMDKIVSHACITSDIKLSGAPVWHQTQPSEAQKADDSLFFHLDLLPPTV